MIALRALLGGWLIVLVFAGCSTREQPVREGLRESSVGGVVTGRIEPADYFKDVERRNIEAREDERRRLAQENPDRAFNTETGRYEFVEEDTERRWNEEEQRWEFTPTVPQEAQDKLEDEAPDAN